LTSKECHGRYVGLTNDEIEQLREFLREHVSSFEELESLLFFARAPRRAWTLLEVSAALKLADDMTEAALSGLLAFVTRAGEGSTALYSYAPRAGLEPLVECLRRAYDEERLTIVQIMSANALQRVRNAAARQLADAFRLERTKK